jgi:hypothetical protein
MLALACKVPFQDVHLQVVLHHLGKVSVVLYVPDDEKMQELRYQIS